MQASLTGTRRLEESSADTGWVEAAEEEEGSRAEIAEAGAVAIQIPYDVWGEIWVVDGNDLQRSRDALLFTQVWLFWRSMEELALANSENDKWDALTWIFRPAIRKYYV